MQAREKEREKMTHDRTFHLILKQRKNFIERRISAEQMKRLIYGAKWGKVEGGSKGKIKIDICLD